MAAPQTVSRWAPLAQKYGKRFGIPTKVLLGLIDVESGGRTNLTSSAGAHGLTQFMPGTARQYKVKTNDPASSIRGAAQYLKDLGYAKNPQFALGAYNGGPGNPQYSYAAEVLKRAGQYGGLKLGGTTAPALGQTLAAPQSAAAPPEPGPGATISAAVQPRQLGGVSPPPPPQFAAQVAQPAGYTPAPGVDPATQRPDLRAQLHETLTRNTPPPYTPVSPTVPFTTPGSGAGTVERRPDTGLNYGRVVVAPGANRGGVSLQKPLVGFLKQTAGVAGKPIQVTTGTNHNQYVAGTDRESDHWRGNAVDIGVPVDGSRGDLIATSALIAAGVPARKARQMAQQGGLYNLNVKGRRLQVIWKTNQGGNHHDHVHIGYR